MTSKTFFMMPAAILALAGTSLMAQNAEIDVNGDGMYSYPELQAVLPEVTEVDFTLLDVSGDGLLDAEEIAAGSQAEILPAMDG